MLKLLLLLLFIIRLKWKVEVLIFRTETNQKTLK